MDYNQYQSDSSSYPPYRRTNPFASASLIMGILAVLSLCTVYFPIVFGSLSIIFAILSKGNQKHMTGISQAGVITSMFGITLSIVTIGATLFILFTNPTIYQEYKQELNKMFTQQYGISYDEWIEQNEIGNESIYHE